MKKIKEICEMISWVFSAIIMVVSTFWMIDIFRKTKEEDRIMEEDENENE